MLPAFFARLPHFRSRIISIGTFFRTHYRNISRRWIALHLRIVSAGLCRSAGTLEIYSLLTARALRTHRTLRLKCCIFPRFAGTGRFIRFAGFNWLTGFAGFAGFAGAVRFAGTVRRYRTHAIPVIAPDNDRH